MALVEVMYLRGMQLDKGYLTHPFSTSMWCSLYEVYAAAAAGWTGVRAKEAQRASRTLLWVRISLRFSMWCAVQ